jgi:hypothetical protein
MKAGALACAKQALATEDQVAESEDPAVATDVLHEAQGIRVISYW